MDEKKLTINQALNLAIEKHNQGKLNEARLIYKKILEKHPDNADALHLLGIISHQVGKYEDAIKFIAKAIELKPNIAMYHSNLAMTYDALNDEEKSTRNFEKALKIDPKYNKAYLAHYNLGVYYKNIGKINLALKHYDKAIELNKEFPEAHWNKGLILLLLEKYKKGWEEYEYRFAKEEPTDSRNFQKQKWDGSSLQGKKILIVSEQGFGDNIQFIRYIPLVKKTGAYVILECKKETRRLFENFPGVDEFVEKQKTVIPNIEFDKFIHIMSLPRIFNTDSNTIPNKTPYLKANQELVEKFKAKLKSDNFKIGITWAGNPRQDNDKNRSTTFDNFKVLKQIPNIDLISLQKGEAAKQLNDMDIINMENDIKDFADTAAIIKNLDLVISVDTALAHLAGAMDKPIWTLLTFIPDWRWSLKRKDCPWYPKMRLFRQKKPGEWKSVFDEVVKELRNHLNYHR